MNVSALAPSAAQSLVEYLGYHNTERRHSSVGRRPPAAFEQRGHGEASPISAASQVPASWRPLEGYRFGSLAIGAAVSSRCAF